MQPLPGRTKLILFYIEDIVQICEKINAHVETYRISISMWIYIYEPCHTVNHIEIKSFNVYLTSIAHLINLRYYKQDVAYYISFLGLL